MIGAASLSRTRPLPFPIEAALVAFLLLLAASAWALTDDRMSGMDAGPGTELGGLGWFIGVWVTMMAAMMLPSVAPVALASARIGAQHREQRAAAPAQFVLGYLAAWTAGGLLGYAIVEGARALDLGFLAWDEAGRFVAAGVILVAALYQLAPLKDRCLRRCRMPLLPDPWRPGVVGPLRTGIEFGVACVGCCWALMAALLALGVMSVGWMAFIAALIAAEKLLPSPRRVVSRGVAVVLAVLAVAVAVAPEDVPGLTIPGGMMMMSRA